ncbi:hypothetical protein V6N11_076493 [Hibiscus sabdariffa]|uniref:Uncharacterized protein n=1 Tax=Hibiscus sabdariffa TaxID=183260 RepID=A0ABR2Q6E7_9ROSI
MPDNPSFPTLLVTAQSLGPDGRPLNCLPEVVLPQSLEQTCLSDSQEDARISKKAKEDNPSLDSLNVSLQNRTEGSKDGLLPGTVSYANMAARNPTSQEKSSDSLNFPKDDIVVLEYDYAIDCFGKIPSIKFSSRVHEQIDHNMQSSAGHDLSSENPKPSENELYGPWMTVDTQCCQNIPSNNNNKTTAPKAQRNEVVMGSRFSVLNVVEDVGVEMPVLPKVENITREGHVVAGAGNTKSQVIMPRPKTLKNAAYMQSNPPKKSKGVARNNDGKETDQPSIDQDVTIISQETSGKSDRHSAVTLFDRGYDNPFPSGGKLSKTRGSTGRTQGEGLRRGFSLKKPAELPPKPQHSLHDWMSSLSQQLQTSIAKEQAVVDGAVTLLVANAGHVPPIERLNPDRTSISPRAQAVPEMVMRP